MSSDFAIFFSEKHIPVKLYQPLRNSASAAHIFLCWQTDRAILWTPQLLYNTIAIKVVSTVSAKKASDVRGRWSFLKYQHTSFKVTCPCIISSPPMRPHHWRVSLSALSARPGASSVQDRKLSFAHTHATIPLSLWLLNRVADHPSRRPRRSAGTIAGRTLGDVTSQLPA